MNDQNRKDEKVSYLVDELGKIDDRFIDEVLYRDRYPRRVMRPARKILIAAAVAAILLVPVLSFAARIADNVGPFGAGDPCHDGRVIDPLESKIMALSTESFDKLDVSGEKGFLYDGAVRIIWTEDGEEYRSVTVSDKGSIDRLYRYLNSSHEKTAVEDPTEKSFKVWICFGNGAVMTPYLQPGGGTAFGKLPDYIPEVYPSEEFTSFIMTLI